MGFPVVLCIDDHHEQLELRKAALEFSGFSVETATNGYAAIKMLEETLVGAVLLEYKEEGMDAEALAYQINKRFPNLPIILLSAYTETPERILWLVDEDGLMRVIERVTRRTNTDETHTLAPCINESGPHKKVSPQIAFS